MSPIVDKHFFEAILDDPEAAEFYHGLHSDRVGFAMKTNRGRPDLGEAGQ